MFEGQRITNLRYADDAPLVANNITELTELLERVKVVGAGFGLFMNRSMTKVMIVDRAGKLEPLGRLGDLEPVQEFN